MTISIRDDIVKNVVSALTGITITGGYNTNVALVDINLKDPESMNADQFPALFVIDGDETKNDADVNELRCKIQIIVSGYCKQANDSGDVQADVRKLLADVEKALCADRFRGGLAINTKPMIIKTDHGVLLPFGLFDFTFEVEYFQTYGNVITHD